MKQSIVKHLDFLALVLMTVMLVSCGPNATDDSFFTEQERDLTHPETRPRPSSSYILEEGEYHENGECRSQSGTEYLAKVKRLDNGSIHNQVAYGIAIVDKAYGEVFSLGENDGPQNVLRVNPTHQAFSARAYPENLTDWDQRRRGASRTIRVQIHSHQSFEIIFYDNDRPDVEIATVHLGRCQ